MPGSSARSPPAEFLARFPKAVDVTAENPKAVAARTAAWLAPKTPRISIQGARGSYSDEASLRWAPARVLLGRHTFAEAVDAAASRACDAAVLPIWNTTIGPIEEVAQELERTRLRVVSLLTLPIRHAVLAPRGGATPTKLYGHPKALLQCPRALAQRWPRARLVEEDAASVAERWAASGSPEPGAGLLGNPQIAPLYGLVILDPNMSDVEGNATTFALAVANRER